MHFFHPQLKAMCKREVNRCDSCQRYKAVVRGHGETAGREAAVLPWHDVAVDLIGPWEVNTGGQLLQLNALTIIDLVTNLVEVV